jgi:hypothetical protein
MANKVVTLPFDQPDDKTCGLATLVDQGESILVYGAASEALNALGVKLTSRVLYISTDPGDLVIDIYGGSDTTASVAQKMGRRWLTVEQEPKTFYAFTQPRLELVTKGLDPGGVTDKFSWSGGGQFTVLEPK